MGTEKCHSLYILYRMAARELVEKAQRIMVMHIGKVVEIGLLSCVLPVPNCILEEHDGKHHVGNNYLSRGRSKGWVIVHPGELCDCQTLESFSVHLDLPL